MSVSSIPPKLPQTRWCWLPEPFTPRSFCFVLKSTLPRWVKAYKIIRSAVFTLQLRDGVDQDTTALPIASALHASIGGDLIQLLPMSNLGPST